MSTPTATTAAQPPEITTTSPAGHTTPIQTEAPAQPSAATTAPTSNPTPTPSSIPTSTPAPAQNPTNATDHLQTPSPNAAPVTQNVPIAQQEELTYNEKLNAADRLWKFKMALTIALILVGLIGIGCIAWAVDRANHLIEGLGYGYDSMWALPWGLITLSISIIWCVICIARFLSRKRPVHPGIRVTMDLLLWLGIIPTALLLMAVLYDVIYWGQDGTLGSYEGFSTSYGGYELQPNNTWTWVPDTDRYGSSVTYPRSCNYSSTVYSQYYNPNVPFHNCAELDAYVNALWQAKPNYARVILTGVVCQWIAVALHFALFVWACVDCHKKRRTKISNDAEKLAASIVQSMVQNGAIIPTSRQLQTRANGWQQAYEPLQSAPGSFSGQGGYAQPPYAQQGMYQGYQQPQMQMRGANGQQMYAPQMQGPNGPQMRQQQQRARPVSGEQPLPPLPPRPQPAQQQQQQQQQEIAQPGPSSDKGKASATGEPAGGVATSYYEPER